MRDDQIRDLLCTLEDDRVPDPAFADELHATLAGMSRRPARRWPLVLLAAAAILALAGGAALGSGLIDPPVTAEATPTPSPSETRAGSVTPSPTASAATPSAIASPSADPQTPAPSPTPYERPEQVLPPGGLVVVEVDGLRIRQQANTASESVATAARGEVLYLADAHAGPGATIPPVRADGFEWYWVMYAPGYRDWPAEPALEDIVDGWVARGPTSAPFVELLPPRCPGGTDLSSLVTITAYERVACVGDRQLEIVGTIGCPFCDSLSYPGVWEPNWLAGYFRLPNMFASSWEGYAATREWPPFIILAWPPEQPKPESDLRGSILRVTGHFADAHSADCVIVSEEDGQEVASDPEAADWYCRTLFVVETWEIVGTDPDFERDPF